MFVFFVIAFLISFGEMFIVFKSTSTKTGFKPTWIIGVTTVAKVDAGKITSSPFFNLYFFFKASSTIKLAEDPLLVAIPYLQPIFDANFFSNNFTFGPREIQPLSNESIKLLISLWSKIGALKLKDL